jgi:uncharacterized membrane protein
MHAAVALMPLALGPLQFSPRLRRERPALHRRLGTIYLGGSALAALTAFYLGVTITYEGSIVPVTLLAVLWAFFVACAWITARRRHLAVHRLFAIRTYACAMVFVVLRILDDVGYDAMFPFIRNEGVREATHEWISCFVPLLLVEAAIAWVPSLRRRGAAA